MGSPTSPHTPRTLVIMPAWNEEEALPGTITELQETVPFVDLVVVNDGRVPFHGAPSEVFQHGPELEAMGLGVPQMTRVFNRLRAMGVDIGPSVYTIEQAKAAVLAKLKGVG